MLENNEPMQEMGIDHQEMDELNEMFKFDEKCICRWPKIEVWFECGKECKCIYGYFYGFKKRCNTKKLVIYYCGKWYFIKADSIVYWKIWRRH